jgi:hypothetical protein
MLNGELVAAINSIEEKLKDERFAVERFPEIKDANGEIHRDWVDLKAECDSGMFKRILIHRGVAQPSELERARQELCQAAQHYRTNKSKDDCYKLVMVNCMLILGERAGYPAEKLDELKKTCCVYQFAGDICQINKQGGL